MKNKKIWTITLLILAALALAITAAAEIASQVSKTVTTRKPRQAYELCYTNSLDEMHVLEGIESGWEIDNRAGMPKMTTENNGIISDVMTDEHSRLLRYFNRVTEGKLDLQFSVVYQYNFNGNVLRLSDEDNTDTYYLVTKENAFWLKNEAGELTQISDKFQQLTDCNVLFRVIIDLDNCTSTTYINNQPCGTHPLTGSAIRCLSFETLDETCNTTEVKGGYIQANYAIYEDFSYPSSSINCEFTNASQLSLNWDVLSLPSGVTTARSFDALGAKVSFNLNTYLANGSAGAFELCAGETAIVEISAKDGSLYANGRRLKSFTDQMWYHLRVEADTETQKAVIKLNNKIIDTVDFLAKKNYVDQIRFKNSGTTAILLDDIMVYNLLDYVIEEPVIPDGADDYTVGINVCSLWENGSHWGWSTISPYDDLLPVLGYYDEGLPEVADWEIKFMVEHGIDFQAFCWYAPATNAPIKANSKHLDNAFLNSKYGDMMKFCLLWEAANGAKPENSAAFRNYYVPFWIENYFSNPRYMTIDNRPVLAIFGANELIEKFGTGLKAEFDYLREEVKKLGFDDMIILDCNGNQNDIAQYGFDGWYAYNWGTDGYSLEVNKAANIRAQQTRDVYAVPTVSVGFNNVGWSCSRHPLMTVADFKAANVWVKDTYLPTYANKDNSDKDDWQDRFVMLSTWNEYGEGTYLMPCEGTNGFGYLDALRAVYTEDNAHTDIVPTAEQLEQITHNYPQDRRVLRSNGYYTIPESSNKRVYDFTQQNAYQSYLSMCNLSSAVTVSANGTTFTTLPTGQSDDAILFLNEIMTSDLIAEDITRIRVVASGIPAGQSMQLFYATDGASYSEGNSIKVPSSTTAETEFLFDLGNRTTWRGDITGLRLDPLQINNTSFTIRSITFELAQELPSLYVNGVQISSPIYPENKDGVDYFPFDPGVSLINYHLYTYHEWDSTTQTLTLYRNGHSYQFIPGHDMVLVDGSDQTRLGGTVYLQDGIPMLPIKELAQVLGLHCARNGIDYDITTPEESLYDSADGIWIFNHPGNTRGWSAVNANIDFVDDCLRMNALQKSDGRYDPILSIEQLNLDCSQYRTLEIRCRWSMSSAASDTLGFYFATSEQPGLSESKRVKHTIGKDSDGYQIIQIDMSQNENWSGTLTQLRFDPFDSAGTMDIAYIRFVEAETEHVLLQENAESGENAFFSYNATVAIAEDPEAHLNQCYHVTGTPGNWLYTLKQVTFTPGTTYQIDFDVMLDSTGKNEASEIFCNMQYLDASGTVDHLVKELRISKSDGWVHYSARYTIDSASTNRGNDQFTIYSNPKGNNNEKETAYYLDNVRVVAVPETVEPVATYDLNMFMFGNSILHHNPNAGLGWYGDWGMAASSEDNDYIHRLLHRLSEKYGEVPYSIASIGPFESAIAAQDNVDYSSALASYEAQFQACTNVPEIVTVQMGENVMGGLSVSQYKNAVMQLIAMIRRNAPDCVIVLCTPFWGGDEKIEAVNQIAGEIENLAVAPLHTLNTDENKALGLFEHSGVAIHPGDTGMDNIAKLIYRELDTLLAKNFEPNYVILPRSMEIIASSNQITSEGGKLYLALRTTPTCAGRVTHWSSSDSNIASVDDNGIVTAKNDGVVTITAESLLTKNLKATYTITVSGQAPAYTITYNANAPYGSTDSVLGMPEANCLAKGQTTLSPSVPTLRHYLFAGWALTADATPADVITELSVSSDVMVYAVWREATFWDFEIDGDMQGMSVVNGFNVFVREGRLMSIATDTDIESGNVLTFISPELSIPSDRYRTFMLKMQNTKYQDGTKITLQIFSDAGTYTFVKDVTTTDYTTYTFDISSIQGTITGFRFTPTDMDCTINIEEIGFTTSET